MTLGGNVIFLLLCKCLIKNIGFINDHVLSDIFRNFKADEYFLFFTDIKKFVNDRIKN